MSAAHGVLIVDKPRGPTSHDIVSGARRLLQTRRVGHAGTLDPMATGVMVLLFGEATKLSGYLTSDDKAYQAKVAFGRETDTLDAEGRVVRHAELESDWLTESRLEQALSDERQRTTQMPPAFSAVRVGGRRAHRLSRRGEAVQLEPRTVRVAQLQLVAWSATQARLQLRVSKGYYVRALARDLGERLQVPAHLSELRRTASGAFTVDDAVAWPPSSPPALLPLAEIARRHFACRCLTPAGVERARHGQILTREHFTNAPEPDPHDSASATATLAWLDGQNELVALGIQREPGIYAVVRGFRS
jgi:tRNA pseudouridine55 synthase